MDSVLTEQSHPVPLVELRNVVKRYPTPLGDFSALKGISLAFNRGEFIGILGKSGAGKTTLVNMITGVDDVSSGEILFEGKPVHHLNEDEKSLWRGGSIGVVYQTFQLLSTLSLIDNIMLPMEFCGLYRPGVSEERALGLLRAVELEDHAYKKPTAISGGQQQRVAIARALANNPPLIVADEPTGSLDSSTAETIFKIFADLVQQGKTIILVSHDRTIDKRFSRIFTLADGEIVGEDLN